MPGPEDKKTAWGGSKNDRDARRVAKAYQATGKLQRKHRTIGTGRKPASKGFWDWLFNTDDD